MGLALTFGVTGSLIPQSKASAFITLPQINNLGTLVAIPQLSVSSSPAQEAVVQESKPLEPTVSLAPSRSLLGAAAPSTSTLAAPPDPLAALEATPSDPLAALETVPSGPLAALESPDADGLAKVALESPASPLASTLIDPSPAIHQVQPGDTVSDIAETHQVSTEALVQTNNIDDPNLIGVDETLSIPTPGLPAVPLLASAWHAGMGGSNPELTSGSVTSELEPVVVPDRELVSGKVELSIPSAVIESERGTPNIQAVSSAPDSEETAVDFSQVETQVDRPRQNKTDAMQAMATNGRSSTPDSQSGAAADQYTKIAKRTIIPQVPSLTLPPLSSIEDHLPSTWTTGQKHIWPAKGVLTSGYGWRWGRMHRGIDIAAPVGTTVVATAPGVVITAEWNSGGYGNLVEVRHPDGSLTLYAHNHRITSRVGQQVTQGEKIAEMGSTGRSTGPHTHYELHPAGKGAVNPLRYLVSRR